MSVLTCKHRKRHIKSLGIAQSWQCTAICTSLSYRRGIVVSESLVPWLLRFGSIIFSKFFIMVYIVHWLCTLYYFLSFIFCINSHVLFPWRIKSTKARSSNSVNFAYFVKRNTKNDMGLLKRGISISSWPIKTVWQQFLLKKSSWFSINRWVRNETE